MFFMPFQRLGIENEAKICQGFPLSEIDTSLIYILPVRGFLIFGDVRVEFLIISNFL